MTDAEFRKALKDDADALWDLYRTTIQLDAKLAGLIKARADAAFDRWNDFSRVSIRHEDERFKARYHEAEKALVRLKAY